VALLSISALLGVNVSFRGELLHAYVKRDFWVTTVDLHALVQMQEVFVETMAIAKVMLKTHRPSAYVKRASKECHAQLNAQAHRKMVNHVMGVENAHLKKEM